MQCQNYAPNKTVLKLILTEVRLMQAWFYANNYESTDLHPPSWDLGVVGEYVLYCCIVLVMLFPASDHFVNYIK